MNDGEEPLRKAALPFPLAILLIKRALIELHMTLYSFEKLYLKLFCKFNPVIPTL